jgi:hypothetical protein
VEGLINGRRFGLVWFGLVCFPGARSGRNPIDHVQLRIPDLEKLEIQKAPGRARRRGGNAWGALRALSLSVALRLESFPQIS